MERNSEERPIMNDSQRSSIYFDWSDLVPVDIESKYRKIYGNRRKSDARACVAIPPTASPAEVAVASPPPLLHIKQLKT